MPHHDVLFRGLLGVAAAAALLTAGTGAATAHGAPEPARAVAAPAKPLGAQSSAGHYLVDGARIHTQPSTGSTTVGYGYTRHSVTVQCRRVVAGQEWFHHTDTTTGVTGWGRWDVVVPYIAVGDC